VVIDSEGRTPSGARVRDGAAPTLIATVASFGEGADGKVDLQKVLGELHHRGIRSVLLEGGPQLAGAFLAAGLVDRVVYYLAPKLLGDGPAALVGAGVTTITGAIDLEVLDVDRIGPDLRLTAKLRSPAI
jgi:diaminohydroxyphosphoribosylaminopyrimidine deaminase/5-amino-6-(5-phosphoribosylamino)uracil reductase